MPSNTTFSSLCIAPHGSVAGRLRPQTGAPPGRFGKARPLMHQISPAPCTSGPTSGAISPSFRQAALITQLDGFAQLEDPPLPGQDHPVPDTLADGSRLVRCVRVMFTGALLSGALVLGLLVGAAIAAVSYTGPLGAPAGATATSKPSRTQQPGRYHPDTERPDQAHPSAVRAA